MSIELYAAKEEEIIPVTIKGSDDIITESPTQELTSEDAVVEAGKHTEHYSRSLHKYVSPTSSRRIINF